MTASAWALGGYLLPVPDGPPHRRQRLGSDPDARLTVSVEDAVRKFEQDFGYGRQLGHTRSQGEGR